MKEMLSCPSMGERLATVLNITKFGRFCIVNLQIAAKVSPFQVQSIFKLTGNLKTDHVAPKLQQNTYIRINMKYVTCSTISGNIDTSEQVCLQGIIQ